jgi:hypothetical protein
MSPSGSQGTQCIHPDFSSRRRHGYVPAERIHVHIPGHIGWILGSYLRDIISTTAFKFCRDNATRESHVAALFNYFNVPNIRVIQP